MKGETPLKRRLSFEVRQSEKPRIKVPLGGWRVLRVRQVDLGVWRVHFEETAE